MRSIRLRNNCLQHATTTKYSPEANKDQTKQLADYQINYQLHGNLDTQINRQIPINTSKSHKIQKYQFGLNID